MRRRTAPRRAGSKVAKSAVRPLADQVDFLRAQQRRPRRAAPARWPRWPGGWPSGCRRGGGSAGRAGWTSARPSGRRWAPAGVPVVTHHKPRKVHKPELVVLCDVSGSVAGFSHFTLMLTQALREHFTRCGPSPSSTPPTRSPGSSGPAPTWPTPSPGSAAEADVVWPSTGTATTATRSRCSPTAGPTPSGRRRRCSCSATRAPTTAPPGSPVLADLVRRSRHGALAQPRAAAAVGQRGLRRRPATARSSTWSSAATPRSSPTSSRPL